MAIFRDYLHYSDLLAGFFVLDAAFLGAPVEDDFEDFGDFEADEDFDAEDEVRERPEDAPVRERPEGDSGLCSSVMSV